MSPLSRVTRCALLVAGCALLLPACGQRAAPLLPTAAPEVTVDAPQDIEVTDTYYLEGYTAAVESVDVYSQVNGYLSKIYFQDGADVKEGDPLFLIDPRPYQATFDQAKAEVNRVQKQLDKLSKDLARAEQLLPRKTITQEEYDQAFSEHAAATAELKSRQAALEVANLNLHFAAIKSPISGRISRRLVTVGNLVTANTTLLTTIVSIKPMYAYFDVDEPTVLKVREAIREGKIRSARESQVNVFLGLDNQEGYPYEGVIDFVENRIDPSTGTLKVRGLFANADDALAPGLHARIKLPMGQPYQALAIPERAIATNQGRKIAYIVDKENRVRERAITLGPQQGELRVIAAGISPGERVIVNGLQRVRDGIQVTPLTAEPAQADASAEKVPPVESAPASVKQPPQKEGD
jgi:RND family efflux transporter MFP subunit